MFAAANFEKAGRFDRLNCMNCPRFTERVPIGYAGPCPNRANLGLVQVGNLKASHLCSRRSTGSEAPVNKTAWDEGPVDGQPPVDPHNDVPVDPDVNMPGPPLVPDDDHPDEQDTQPPDDHMPPADPHGSRWHTPSFAAALGRDDSVS